MMQHRRAERFHGRIVFFKRFFILLSAAVGATLSADVTEVETQMGKLVADWLKSVQSGAWLTVPGFIIVAALLEPFRRFVGDPRSWGVVNVTLNELRDKVFDDVGDDPVHAHRATLFKHRRWSWCTRQRFWGGWLVPVERSGHAKRKTNIVFMAPDDADKVEGVAGMAWAAGHYIYVHDLPDLEADQSDEAINEYARKSRMAPEEVRKRLPKERALCGCAVEVRGNIWGVVVVGSRRPTIDMEKFDRYYEFTAEVLGKTLEGR